MTVSYCGMAWKTAVSCQEVNQAGGMENGPNKYEFALTHIHLSSSVDIRSHFLGASLSQPSDSPISHTFIIPPSPLCVRPNTLLGDS